MTEATIRVYSNAVFYSGVECYIFMLYNFILYKLRNSQKLYPAKFPAMNMLTLKLLYIIG